MEALSSNYKSTYPVVKSCKDCNQTLAEKVNQCSRCKIAAYCNQECQRRDWPKHKLGCKAPRKSEIPFPNVSLEEVKLNGVTVVSYRYIETPTDQTSKIHFFHTFYLDMMKMIVRIMLEKIMSKEELKISLDYFFTSGKKLAIEKGSELRQQGKLSEANRVKEEQQPMHQALDILAEFTRSVQFTLPRNREEIFLDWTQKISNGSLEYLYEKLKWKKNEVDYSPLRKLGIKNTSLSCFQYVYMKTENIFKANQLLQSLQKLDEMDFSYWRKLGFSNTKEPKNGDVVLYLKENKITHAAIYLGDGIVEHKPGIITAYAYESKWSELTPQYGNRIIFLCKSS